MRRGPLVQLEAWRTQLDAFLVSDPDASQPAAALSRETLSAAEVAATVFSSRAAYALPADHSSMRDLDSIKRPLLDRIHNLASLPPSARTDLLRNVDAIGALQGQDVHQFALAIGELRRLNLLAIGAFLVAVVIDGLILLCGILGARPDSYLDMRHPSDLLDIQELALETVMSLSLGESVEAPVRSPFIRRCRALLEHVTVDSDLAYSGFPAVLPSAAVQDLRLVEIGVLLALGLAQRQSDGDLALRTRFVLWIAHCAQKDLSQTAALDSLNVTTC